MTYDEALAKRVRKLAGDADERKMFGGLAFMINGKMVCGVLSNELVVRVEPDKYEEALKRIGVREMDFTGKPLKGFVYVGPAGYKTDKDLKSWVDLGLEFARSFKSKKFRATF